MREKEALASIPEPEAMLASFPHKTQAHALPQSCSLGPCWGGCSAHWVVKVPGGQGCPLSPPQGGCHSQTRRTPVSGSG